MSEHAKDRPAREEIELTSIDAESWLYMYEGMIKIRAFEEQVNELYVSARCLGWPTFTLARKLWL